MAIIRNKMNNNYQVVFVKPKEVILKEIKIPSPKKGEVLIETIVTQISTGTELTILSGEFPEGSYWSRYAKYPFYAGYSNVGKVIDAGKGVNKDLIGKIVVTETPHASYVISDSKELGLVPKGLSLAPTAPHIFCGWEPGPPRRISAHLQAKCRH